MSILDRALRVGEGKKFKTFERNVELINAFEPELELESDEELRERYESLRERHLDGEALDDLLYESFALTREAGKRALGQRHFDVQLIGGMGLDGGASRDETVYPWRGGGPRLAAFNASPARRDALWMKPIYDLLGVTVGIL